VKGHSSVAVILLKLAHSQVADFARVFLLDISVTFFREC